LISLGKKEYFSDHRRVGKSKVKGFQGMPTPPSTRKIFKSAKERKAAPKPPERNGRQRRREARLKERKQLEEK